MALPEPGMVQAAGGLGGTHDGRLWAPAIHLSVFGSAPDPAAGGPGPWRQELAKKQGIPGTHRGRRERGKARLAACRCRRAGEEDEVAWGL